MLTFLFFFKFYHYLYETTLIQQTYYIMRPPPNYIQVLKDNRCLKEKYLGKWASTRVRNTSLAYLGLNFIPDSACPNPLQHCQECPGDHITPSGVTLRLPPSTMRVIQFLRSSTEPTSPVGWLSQKVAPRLLKHCLREPRKNKILLKEKKKTLQRLQGTWKNWNFN